MKRILIYSFLLLWLCNNLYSQSVIVKGRVRCMNPTASSTRGAENIVVVPTFMPSKSAITATNPQGYFEFNTGTPLPVLQDKQINVYLVSKCGNCPETVKRIFVSEDQDRLNKDASKCYVTIKDWKLSKACNELELPARTADSILGVVVKQPEDKLGQASSATALLGSPTLLNLLTNLISVVGTVSNFGTFRATELSPGKIDYGRFLFSSAITHTANTGFNFSPSRDMSEAIFWNTASIAQSRKPYNISAFTNVRNNVKVAGFAKLTDRISLGAGLIYTWQDEFRGVTYSNINNPLNKVKVDSVGLRLKEYAIYLGPAIRLTPRFSAGFAIKGIWQDFNIPNRLVIGNDANGNTTNTFTDSSIKQDKFDVDISFMYKVSKAFQVGLNLMNLAGSELHADAFVPAQVNKPILKQRALGLGLCYKLQRFNFGVDILVTEDDFYDVSLGINYVPFNSALLSAGIAFKQLSYSIAFRVKHFRIAYVDDNGLMINQKNDPRSSILNGRIYGGFIFDF